MVNKEELTSIKNDVEGLLDGYMATEVDDLADRISDLLYESDPDGEKGDDPILEALATLGSSLEDLSSDIESVHEAFKDLEDALDDD